MHIPLLSIIIFTPTVAGLLILLIPRENKQAVRWIALFASTFTFLLSVLVYLFYNVANGGYQFVEKMDWVPKFGIS